MKLNNKGVTLVEIIVSVSLITVVLVFLLRLLVTLKGMDDASLDTLKYQEKTSLIIDYVQGFIKDQKNCEFTDNNKISCERDGSEKDEMSIEIDNANKKITIKNGFNGGSTNKTWKFPNDAKISTINSENLDNPKGFIITINVTDDKGRVYPIEISYVSPEIPTTP